VTERVSSGVSTLDMFKECKRPLFIFMVCCMLLTAATELGTNQWITELLSNVGVPSILLLVLINGLMALGRSYAGHIEHRLSPGGMLLFSAIFSAAGLYMLSFLGGYWSFAAAAVFAIGICFFWPTMLGFVSTYLPKTGALGLSVMGGAGMLSVSLILPFIGDIYEAQTQLHLPEGYSLLPTSAEVSEILKNAKLAGGAATLKYVAILPVLLTLAFGILYGLRKKMVIKNTI
ncbi:MAG: MFS transporter, partial [Cytophagaceae bacterium]